MTRSSGEELHDRGVAVEHTHGDASTGSSLARWRTSPRRRLGLITTSVVLGAIIAVGFAIADRPVHERLVALTLVSAPPTEVSPTVSPPIASTLATIAEDDRTTTPDVGTAPPSNASSSDPSPSTPSSSSPATDAFCAAFDGLADGEVPEAYVRSAEHVRDVEGLIALAPPSLVDQLSLHRDFLASGAIDPNNPESNVTSNWPAPVQAAVVTIRAQGSLACTTARSSIDVDSDASVIASDLPASSES